MALKKEESNYLYGEKIRSGKSSIQANSELDFLNESQIEFRELKKEINHLNIELNKKDKEIEELKNKIKEDKNKRLLEGLGITGKKEVDKESKGATLLNVKRVIKFTEIGVPFTKTDLAKDLMMSSTVIEEILEFLNRHTNIKFNLEGSRYVRTS